MPSRMEALGRRDGSRRALAFPTLDAARSFLHGLVTDPDAIRTLRQVVLDGRTSGAVASRPLHDHEIFDLAARELLTGRLFLLEVPRRPARCNLAPEPVEQPLPEETRRADETESDDLVLKVEIAGESALLLDMEVQEDEPLVLEMEVTDTEPLVLELELEAEDRLLLDMEVDGEAPLVLGMEIAE